MRISSVDGGVAGSPPLTARKARTQARPHCRRGRRIGRRGCGGADGFEAPVFGARVFGQVTTLPLEGEDGPLAASDMNGVASDRAGAWYVTTEHSLVLHVSAAGRVRSVATLEGVDLSGVAVSPDGSALFVADRGNYKIRRVEAATGAVTTLAGSGTRGSADGVGGAAQFNSPNGVAISPDGSALFLADFSNRARPSEPAWWEPGAALAP